MLSFLWSLLLFGNQGDLQQKLAAHLCHDKLRQLVWVTFWWEMKLWDYISTDNIIKADMLDAEKSHRELKSAEETVFEGT